MLDGQQPRGVIMHDVERPAAEQAHHHRGSEGIARPDRVNDRACLRRSGRHHPVGHKKGARRPAGERRQP